ncbi:hypothetical protein TNCT_577811 [Trichonephila clavata]|uniref:Uncharacterized protein n=1 Tax=Trichonephila clavata TaxID=2740835 RepID=A0A8X6EZL7_TRICU|nr:hypothetical protein TNCT_577811 [Trichonephila clavata]
MMSIVLVHYFSALAFSPQGDAGEHHSMLFRFGGARETPGLDLRKQQSSKNLVLHSPFGKNPVTSQSGPDSDHQSSDVAQGNTFFSFLSSG